MNSQKYWEKREAEQRKKDITDEKEYDKQIKRIYKDMQDAVQGEINGFFGRYASKEGISLAEAKKRVNKLDIEAYERKAKRYVRERDFSPTANEEMRLYNLTMKVNRLEMLKANIGLELIAGHDELQKFMDGILQGRTEDELKRQAGILGKTITNNAQKAHAIVNASFHNATFSERIWTYQNILKAEMSSLLQSGLIQGKNPRLLARELKKRFDVKTSDAERLMRTELARVQTEAQRQSFIRNGFEEYTFLALGDCCDMCRPLDGKHFKVKDMMPGKNAPPMHPHCRCSTSAYEDSKEYEAWLDYLDKGGTTAEWNAKGKAKWQKALEKSVKSSKIELRRLNLQFFATKEKQYGKKIGKHAQDFGLDPSKAEDREKMYKIINDIMDNSDIIKTGKWRGQEEEVDFYIKGEDVVICSKEKEFISILKGGANNARIKNARNK